MTTAAGSADVELVGERVRLRPWRAADRAPFAALNADPEVMRHFPAPLSRAESDAVADRIAAHFAAHGFGLWALEAPVGDAAPEFLGFTGLALRAFAAPFTPCVEVAWRLARAGWGRGYATEAARLAVRFGLERLRLREIVAFTAPDNVRSRRVMAKLGMTRDPRDDFDHPALPPGHALSRHVLYRLRAE